MKRRIDRQNTEKLLGQRSGGRLRSSVMALAATLAAATGNRHEGCSFPRGPYHAPGYNEPTKSANESTAQVLKEHFGVRHVEPLTCRLMKGHEEHEENLKDLKRF